MFITFEGGEGSGKSTQIKLLAEYLESQGAQVVLTREPGGTPGAEEIRNVLLSGEPNKFDSITEMMLFFAARRDHVEKVIKPALAEGKIVLSDRFADSSLVMQCNAGNVDLFTFNKLYDIAIGGFEPGLTLILDISVEEGFKRVNARGADGINRMELKGLKYHEDIRNGLLALAEDEPKRCMLVDASKSVQEVQSYIQGVVDYKLAWRYNDKSTV